MSVKKLPVVRRDVYDNSMIETFQRCPRLFYYEYVLNRAPAGKNFSIGFGIAYHTYREYLEKAYISATEGGATFDECAPLAHEYALQMALKNFTDPPTDHAKKYLNTGRLRETCEKAFRRWTAEKKNNRLQVMYVETAFDLPLPSGRRHGGRFDQVVSWNSKLWVRDFKTTSRMGKNYAKKFDPNNQMTGYTWATQELSGRPVEGVIIEVVYNVTNTGPDFHQFLSTRSKHHIDKWIITQERERDMLDVCFNEGEWPMRTLACDDFGGCPYRDACGQSSEASVEEWLLSNTVESVWDFMDPDSEEGLPV